MHPRHDQQMQERIVSLAAGELSGLAAWRLRRHLSGCRSCRVEWEQTRRLWDGLERMATEPTPEAVRAHVLEDISAAVPQTRAAKSTIRIGGIVMRRPTFAVLCAVPLLAVTGALASHLIGFRPSGSFSDRSGHMWNFTTDFKGEIEFTDAQGRLVGTFTNDTGDSQNGETDLRLAGNQYDFHGPGSHEIRSAQGVFLGKILAHTVTEKEALRLKGWTREPRGVGEALVWQERDAERNEHSPHGGSGVSGTPYGARGFDQKLGVFWKMRGVSSVRVTRPDGGLVAEIGPGNPLPPTMRRTIPMDLLPTPAQIQRPEFEITVADKTIRESGYGRHIIRDVQGRPLLILDAQPVPPQGTAPEKDQPPRPSQ